MALFTDSDIVTLDDLLLFESTLTQVSTTHGIDISTKIRLATDAIGDKILLYMLRAGHSDPCWPRRVILGLSNVVVTPPVYKWICAEALSRVFAEAYNLQLNTRFQGKLQEYQTQAEAAAEIVFASGIGLVMSPLPKPLAPNAAVTTGVMTAAALFIQTTWVDAHGQESAMSPVTGVVLNGFSAVSVSMASAPTVTPSTAVGWNVYVSETQDGFTRQNTTPIPSSQVWLMPQMGVVSGVAAGQGQMPWRYVLPSRIWRRG